MKDPHQIVRKAFWETFVNNQLFALFDGSANDVRVYDEEVNVREDGLYIILSTQGGTDNSTKHCFRTDCTINIDIVNKTELSVDKRIVDDISEQILEAVLPFPGVCNLTTQSGFQFLNLQLENTNYLNLQISPTKSIIRKILTFSVTVQQL